MFYQRSFPVCTRMMEYNATFWNGWKRVGLLALQNTNGRYWPMSEPSVARENAILLVSGSQCQRHISFLHTDPTQTLHSCTLTRARNPLSIPEMQVAPEQHKLSWMLWVLHFMVFWQLRFCCIWYLTLNAILFKHGSLYIPVFCAWSMAWKQGFPQFLLQIFCIFCVTLCVLLKTTL